MPQISPASTSELLSRKSKFPTFFRTISSDKFQTKAINALVMKFNWKTVAIVGSDDDYGRLGTYSLENYFRESKVCIGFVDILSDKFQNNASQNCRLLDKIQNSTAEAIVLFSKFSNIEGIMKGAIERMLSRTWIASDSWSTSSIISRLSDIQKAGRVFGFTSKRNPVPGFENYVLSMFRGDNNTFIDHHLKKNLSECNKKESCQGSKECGSLSCLASKIDQDVSYNTYLAVQVIVNSLQRLLKCDNEQCQRGTNFTALEVCIALT